MVGMERETKSGLFPLPYVGKVWPTRDLMKGVS
jgi:hypothetical protein